MIKALNKLQIEENYNITKGIYEKLTTNITFSGENLNTLSLRLEINQGCSLSTLPFNEVLDVLARTIKQEK